jgi:Zn-dependent oligopeptidase
MEQESVQIVFYSSVAASKELRVAAKDYEKAMSEFNLDFWMRPDVYNCFVTYHKNANKDGSFAKLDKESQRYIDQTLLEFKRSGLALAVSERTKLINLTKEISDLESKTEVNIAESKEWVEFNVNELAGIPDWMIKKLI